MERECAIYGRNIPDFPQMNIFRLNPSLLIQIGAARKGIPGIETSRRRGVNPKQVCLLLIGGDYVV
jgi:hypothetical protein